MSWYMIGKAVHEGGQIERAVQYVLDAPKASYSFGEGGLQTMHYGGVGIEFMGIEPKTFWVVINTRHANTHANCGHLWSLHAIDKGHPMYSKLRLAFYKIWLEKIYLAGIGE